MQRAKVESSHIKSAGYDPETRTLEIEFNGGGVYQYECASDLYNNLLVSPSKGKFFHQHIKPLGGKKV